MSSHRTLTTVLCAATAPAHPEELSGEGVVVAAFRAAQLTPVPETRRPPMLKSVLAKAATVKVAIILAATGSTGIVVVTSTGALPAPWSGTPTTPPATSHSPTRSTPPSVTPTGTENPATPSGAPEPAMAGLCQAYEAKLRENPGKAWESPAFTALVDAAGGPDEVPAYCASLPDSRPTGRPSDLPTPTEQHTRGSAPETRPTPPSRPETPGGRQPGGEAPAPPGARQNGS